MIGVYDFFDLIFNFLQKLFCKFLKKKEFISYTFTKQNYLPRKKEKKKNIKHKKSEPKRVRFKY
jgi:hypothetical protein